MLYTVRSFESYRFNSSSSFFFFNDTATTEIYTLSLHDALPISRGPSLRLLPHHRAPRLQDLSDDERRPQPGARRLRPRAGVHARGPRARRAGDPRRGAAGGNLHLARPRRGARRPARRLVRHGGRAALGRHRLAGGGLAHDEARLPRAVRALP